MKSELKLHLLSATLAGNLFALPAGSDFITSNHGDMEDYFRAFDSSDARVISSFNYLALTGLDYENYSIATGVYFPIFGVIANGYIREILSSEPSILYRFKYTTPKYRLNLVYSKSQRGSISPTDKDILVNRIDFVQENPEKKILQYNFSSYYLKLGIEYHLGSDMKIGFHQVYEKGKYLDSFLDFPDLNTNFQYQKLKSSFFARQQFGSYITLEGRINLFLHEIKGQDINDNTTKSSGVVSLEFIL